MSRGTRYSDYDRVVDELGGREHGFARLFMAPGVGHCSGGSGAAPIDPLAAVVAWVEDGVAPDTLPAQAGETTRPLCPWPQVARYDGDGSTDAAANFSCADSYGTHPSRRTHPRCRRHCEIPVLSPGGHPMRTTFPRLVTAVSVIALLSAPAVPAAETDVPDHQRLYLHADSGEYLWWSLAPNEPDADQHILTRTCPSQAGLPGAAPCLAGRSGTERSFTLWFHPRSRVAEEVRWGPQGPVRFRFALDVDTPVPDYDVLLAFSAGAGQQVSQPATEVEPGVWEGVLEGSGGLPEQGYGLFGVRIRFSGDGAATLRLGVGGQSWVELPEPVPGWSAGDLWRQSPPAASPTTYTTPLRTLWFADGDWEAVSLEGTLAETRTVTLQTDRPAAAVLGWVEAFGDPVIHALVRDGELHQNRLTEAPHLRLLRNGGEVATGTIPGTIAGGQGTDSVAATHLTSGELALEVAPTDTGQTSAYTGYLVVVYGERTLERMQTSFTPAHSVRQPAMRAVVVASCPTVSEAVPLTRAATAVRVGLDWDSVAASTKWVPRFTLGEGDFPCSEMGTGPEVTLIPSAPQTFHFGATPAYDAAFVSYRDTVIHADVRILYQPE